MTADASVLPTYRGALTPAAWSKVRVTEPICEELQRLALRSCPGCRGKGFLGRRPRVIVCGCVRLGRRA